MQKALRSESRKPETPNPKGPCAHVVDPLVRRASTPMALIALAARKEDVLAILWDSVAWLRLCSFW